jgi:hypothetical protein
MTDRENSSRYDGTHANSYLLKALFCLLLCVGVILAEYAFWNNVFRGYREALQEYAKTNP